MLIQTFERGYKVISHVLTFDIGEIYICRDIAADREYTLVCIKDRAVVPALMEYLTAMVNPRIFNDYIEHFVFDDNFFIVLRYYRGVTLHEKLKGEYCSLRERLQIGAKMLERMLLLDMPEYFQKNCLTESNIIVKPSLDVFFNYVPNDITSFAAADDEGVLKAVLGVFSRLFADELVRKSAPPLNDFYYALQNEQRFNCMEIYQEYTRMRREVEDIPEEEIEKPKSKWFVLWERVKAKLVVLKKMLAVVLLVLAFIYLIYTIDKSIHPDFKANNNYGYIGSVKIQGSK